jgi:hypothetical protein
MPIESPAEGSTPTGVEARVISDIAERQQRGIAKYGMTVEDNPLAMRQWLQHFYEELLDGAVYAKKCIEKIDEIDQRLGSEFVMIDTARMQLLTHLDVLGHQYPALRESLEKMRPIVLSLPTIEDGKV